MNTENTERIKGVDKEKNTLVNSIEINFYNKKEKIRRNLRIGLAEGYIVLGYTATQDKRLDKAKYSDETILPFHGIIQVGYTSL